MTKSEKIEKVIAGAEESLEKLAEVEQILKRTEKETGYKFDYTITRQFLEEDGTLKSDLQDATREDYLDEDIEEDLEDIN